VEACVVGALEMVGEQMTVEQVLSVVRRDNPFYEQSGGGMTLSGGEPLMQFAYSKALLQAAKAEGMHTAIQTSASAPWERLEALLSLTDYWMVDLKHTNNARHKELTGVPNRRILNNLRRLCESGSDLLLRVPWIPGYNVEEGFLQGLVRFLTSMPKPPPVEFMLYHRLGLSKTTALGKDNTFPEQLPAATAEDVAPWIERLRSEGLRVVGS
jgi:pyruvate formate lyase activating enzyme